jgi:4-carboxymuconolactone decarboxylase
MTSELFAKGLKIRTEVLGEAYVQKALASMDDSNRPLQELVTEYCWGLFGGAKASIALSGSMLNLAMISVLNRPQELKAHLHGALTNGLSREQIAEVFLQIAIYAGVPAAVDSFRIAREAFAEIDERTASP